VDETYIKVHGHWRYLYRAINGVTPRQADLPERIAYAREPQKLPVVCGTDPEADVVCVANLLINSDFLAVHALRNIWVTAAQIQIGRFVTALRR
jgi:hypothetical protein